MSTPEKTYWLGFDLGGTKMLAAVFNKEFTILARKKKKTKAHEGVESAVERMLETINGAVEDAGITLSEVAGIGIGCPGPLDLNTGTVIHAPNLGWENFALQDTIAKATGVPVVIMNDVDAGVYGEYCFGAAKGARSVLGVFPGTGVGGGAVINGELLRGTISSCMEIGHIEVIANGPLCGCGRYGCLETVSSRLAIATAAAAAALRGDAPALLEAAGSDVALIKSSTLAASIAAGDSVVEQIVRNAARWLGKGVSTAVNLFAPDVVVLGGGVIEAMSNIIVPEVQAVVDAGCVVAYGTPLKIVAAMLSDDAGICGSAAWARHTLEGTVS